MRGTLAATIAAYQVFKTHNLQGYDDHETCRGKLKCLDTGTVTYLSLVVPGRRSRRGCLGDYQHDPVDKERVRAYQPNLSRHPFPHP